MTASRASLASPFAIVPIEAARDRRLGVMQLRVLLAILSFRNRNTDTCYPSRQKLSARCGYTPNTISRVTGELVELGWLQKTGKGGRSTPSTYRVTVPETLAEVETVSEPETLADPTTVYRPETLADPTTKTLAGSARGKEPTSEPKEKGRARTRDNPAAQVRKPDDIDAQVWSDFLRLRRSKRAPLTPTAWARIEAELGKAVADGWTRNDALAEAVTSGWQGFRYEWLKNRVSTQAGAGPPAGTAWKRLVEHARDGHNGSQVAADDPALAQAVEWLGGMARLRRMTEFELERHRGQFDRLYRDAAGRARSCGS